MTSLGAPRPQPEPLISFNYQKWRQDVKRRARLLDVTEYLAERSETTPYTEQEIQEEDP